VEENKIVPNGHFTFAVEADFLGRPLVLIAQQHTE
jgi:hypothetical protein